MGESDSSGDAEHTDQPAGARMVLEPDAVHEGAEEPTIDCPQCGSTVSLVQIIEEGRCPGYLEGDDAEVESDGERLQEPGCTAKLSLELVWEE